MKLSVCICSAAAGAALAGTALSQTTVGPTVFRSADNGRVWQVNLAPDEPLQWPWETGATQARLTISNLCAGTASEVIVTRQGNELFGRYPLAVETVSAEQLYTIGLKQLYHPGEDDEKCVATVSARIVWLPGVLGRGIDVNPARRRQHADTVMVFAYDKAWSSGAHAAETASLSVTPKGGVASVRDLVGTSGFDTVTLGATGDASLAPQFDGQPYWLSDVRFPSRPIAD